MFEKKILSSKIRIPSWIENEKRKVEDLGMRHAYIKPRTPQTENTSAHRESGTIA
jgi:hypothetical protein